MNNFQKIKRSSVNYLTNLITDKHSPIALIQMKIAMNCLNEKGRINFEEYRTLFSEQIKQWLLQECE